MPLPETRRDDPAEILHGVAVPDPYRWLEDQDSPETRAWIDAQNRYADAIVSHGALAVRDTIARRLEQLYRVDQIGFPSEYGGRYFFSRQRPEEEQSTLYVRDGLEGPDTVFLNPNSLGADHSASVSYLDITHDGALAAYAIREGGDDQIEIRIRDVATLTDLPDRLPKDYYSAISFKRDKSGFYYTRLVPLVGRRVYYHALGSAADQDVEVFGADYGAESIVNGYVSENGRWLLFVVYHGWAENDLLVQDIVANGPIIPVVRNVAAGFNGVFADDTLVIRTDWQAPNRRILTVDLNHLTARRSRCLDDPSGDGWFEGWQEIVASGPEPINDHSAVGGRVFIEILHNAVSQIKSYSLSGEPRGEITLPGPGTAEVPQGHWESPEAFYVFTSYTVPLAIYRYDIKAGVSTRWAQAQVPFDPDLFETRQSWAISRDGTQVPMFLVGRRDLEWDGARPVLLSGYGGFNASLTPQFNPSAVVLAEQGGIFAVANLRGGGEFGEAWHRAGMGAQKQNVFDDFIAIAEWLIQNGVTNPDRLAISGGSNGGLLVGAALTQRPELYRAVICSYPLLDMVRYHLFLQGPQWVPEYGSAADPQQFQSLFAYSPYHHVRSGPHYPAVLFVTGDADTRVAPLHARKMAALLQAAQSQDAMDRPILLHYDTEAGHSGGEPTAKRIANQSFIYAFLFQQLKIMA
jgi:prolyl oligopeptidase